MSLPKKLRPLGEFFKPFVFFGSLFSILGMAAASNFKIKVPIYVEFLTPIAMLFVLVAINTIDDYIDFYVGIDQKAPQTKFSGGSNNYIANKKISPNGALAGALLAFAVALSIGIYLANAYPIIIPFIIVGSITIFLYASLFVYIPFLSELIVMLNYTLIMYASFLLMRESYTNSANTMFVFVPAAILAAMVLFINSIPDMKADGAFKRRTAAVLLKTNGKLSKYYLFWSILAFAILAIGIASGRVSLLFSAEFGLLPIMATVYKNTKNYKDPKKFEQVMGKNIVLMAAFVIIAIILYLLNLNYYL
ncbi:MAG: prenyltransferase [Candidatus Micrarchaeia archaeon]